MPECPNCKAQCESEDRYCSQCGARLNQAEFVDSDATQRSLGLVDVQYNLGLVYFKKEEYQKALETWQKALSMDPDNEILQQRIGEARERLEGAN